MKTIFRKASKKDIPAMKTLFASASEFLRAQGVNQWQNGYPSTQLLEKDIQSEQSYVLLADGEIAAAAVLQTTADPNYETIHGGKWASSGLAACIHRITISADYRGSGLGDTLMQYIISAAESEGFCNLRVDTHEDNVPMQKYLKKHGFKYCGVIYLLEDGAKRVAFDKVWEETT